MKLNSVIIMGLCLLLTSCKSMKGELDVHESITLLKKKSIFSSKTKKVTLEPGKFKATLKASSKKKFKLKVKKASDEKNATFIFTLPEGTEMPGSHGELNLSADKTGQPYDLAIAVDTDSNSHQYDTTESCVAYYETDTVCSWVPSREVCSTVGGGQTCRTREDGREICHDRPVRTHCHTEPGYNDCREVSTPVYGSQDVTYEQTTTTRNVVANLKKGETIKATFDHVDVDTSRHQIASGHCYR